MAAIATNHNVPTIQSNPAIRAYFLFNKWNPYCWMVHSLLIEFFVHTLRSIITILSIESLRSNTATLYTKIY